MSQPVIEQPQSVDHDAEVGRRVFHLMWDRKITQTDMAGHLGLQQSALSKKLRGERRWFVGDLITVSDVLGVTVAYLVGETTETPTPGRGGQVLPRLDSNQEPIGFTPDEADDEAGELIYLDDHRPAPAPIWRADPLRRAA